MIRAAPESGTRPGAAVLRCARCSYPFGGRPGACPECGAHVDPADPRTIAPDRRGRLLRWLTRPPGTPLAVAAAAAGATLDYACSVPAAYFGTLLLGLAGLAAVAAMWMLRAAASVASGVMLGEGWTHGFRRLAGIRWWIAPGIALLAAVVAASGAATWIGWRLRMGQLGPMAEAWRQDPRMVAGLPGADRIPTGSDGLPQHPLDVWFPVPQPEQPTRAADDGFAVWEPGTGFLFERGFYVYAPNLAVDSPLRRSLRALGDGWHAARLIDH